MPSKLTRFSSGIEIKEAASWLTKLIDENVQEDDLLDFSIDGYLSIGVCGPLLGVAVSPPAANSTNEEWVILKETIDSVPDRLYSTALYEPMKIIKTEIGEAPAYLVNGVVYGWFHQNFYYKDPLTLPELIETLVEINLDEQICVHPEDVLRIAQLANSDLPSDSIAGPVRETRVVALSDGLGPIYHKATTISSKFSRDMRPTPAKQTRESIANNSVIGILLDLLSRPSRTGLNQSAVISEILEQHADRRGLSKRNLEAIFSSANKSLKADD